MIGKTKKTQAIDDNSGSKKIKFIDPERELIKFQNERRNVMAESYKYRMPFGYEEGTDEIPTAPKIDKATG